MFPDYNSKGQPELPFTCSSVETIRYLTTTNLSVSSLFPAVQ